ncbi:hypothetical protein ABID41_002507 [Phenylobacterium koreense]|uniref:Uncharacterized protein n=1 Tax=Phenylobacterium koreense TaxID=266125 RepID=A0ABV2EK15_9CAUL
MPDEARIVYLLLAAILVAPAAIVAFRRLFGKKDK